MIAELSFGGQKVRAALDRGVSLAIAVEFGAPGPRHFGVGAPASRPFSIGNFSGSVATGASANCSTITLTPHCQMTHTESVAHLTREGGDAWRVVPRGPMPAVVVSVVPEQARESNETTDPQPFATDTLISKRRLRAAWPMTRMVDRLAAKGLIFNDVDPAPFREKLRNSGFYAEWKSKFGEEAWSLLEESTGKLT